MGAAGAAQQEEHGLSRRRHTRGPRHSRRRLLRRRLGPVGHLLLAVDVVHVAAPHLLPLLHNQLCRLVQEVALRRKRRSRGAGWSRAARCSRPRGGCAECGRSGAATHPPPPASQPPGDPVWLKRQAAPSQRGEAAPTWQSMCSLPSAFFTTLAPLANFLPAGRRQGERSGGKLRLAVAAGRPPRHVGGAMWAAPAAPLRHLPQGCRCTLLPPSGPCSMATPLHCTMATGLTPPSSPQLHPAAAHPPKSLEASPSFTPNASSPMMVVMHFFLFRVLRSSTTCRQGRQGHPGQPGQQQAGYGSAG